MLTPDDNSLGHFPTDGGLSSIDFNDQGAAEGLSRYQLDRLTLSNPHRPEFPLESNAAAQTDNGPAFPFPQIGNRSIHVSLHHPCKALANCDKFTEKRIFVLMLCQSLRQVYQAV
jgi:hypothetical protein